MTDSDSQIEFSQEQKASIELLREVVATPSLSRCEQAVAELLVRRMTELGFEASIDNAGNAVGEICHLDDSGQTTRDIVLLGHMDTVPGDIPVRIENGILHGRGSVDAKGPLVTFIVAASRAAIPKGTRLIVVGAVEEETATSKGARFVSSQYQPDFCIIGEPSNWDAVTLGYKGRVLIDVEISRSMGHTAGQQSGVAESVIDWWNQLSSYIGEFNSNRPKLFDQLLPAIRNFQTESDGLVDVARLHLGIRTPPDFDVSQFATLIHGWSEDAVINMYGEEVAYQSDRKSSLARKFNIAIRAADAKPRFKVKTGTCDMNVVGPVWNCPIVAYGPGDSALDHTPNEHLVLEEYIRAISVLRSVLESL